MIIIWRHCDDYAAPILCVIPGMDSANRRRRYDVTSSLIGWAHTKKNTHTHKKKKKPVQTCSNTVGGIFRCTCIFETLWQQDHFLQNVILVSYVICVNSLASERRGSNSTSVFSNLAYELISWALPVKLQTLVNDKWTLVQLMAWCCQATINYLSQRWQDLCSHMALSCHGGLW